MAEVRHVGERIAVIGSPGSGKSWFSLRLGARLSIPVHHLDVLNWKRGWIATDKDLFRARQVEIMSGESWIIDGNYGDTIDLRMKYADTVIFLDIHRLVCMRNVLSRLVHSRSVKRSDMTEGCEERLNMEFIRFLRFIWNYPSRSRPGIMAKLAGLEPSKKVIVLSSKRAIKIFVRNLPAAG